MTDIPKGFVPHDGGPCPVAMWTKVRVMFGDGRISGPVNARNAVWDHIDDPWFDIIAYKVETDR